MSDPKTIEQFIAENYQEHHYTIGPDDNPNGMNYIRKDGSYQIVSAAQIAKEYAEHFERLRREDALATQGKIRVIESRLADAVRAIELEKQSRVVDRGKIAELKKKVKDSEAALQKIADDAGQLIELDSQFRALRREDALAVHTKLKATLNAQLDEAVKATELEKPVSVTHRLRVADIKKRLRDVSDLLKKLSDEEK